MSDFDSKNERACEEIQELIAWYPGGTLNDDERSIVEKHSAECPVCSDFLHFASEFKEILKERHSPHPAADALVCFAENRAAMDPEQRSVIEKHLAACEDCKDQLAILEEVERTYSQEQAAAASVSDMRKIPVGARSRLRGFWDSLKGSILRPVPAAVYLAVAVLAVGLHLLRPDWMPGGIGDRESGEIGLYTGDGPFPGVVGGIVILPDEMGRMRQPGTEEPAGTRIGAGRAHFLLLELTGLEAPPSPEDIYTVELAREGSAEPVFEVEVPGRIFQENYTLCLSLEETALAPGNYVVRVIGPRGKTVYRSSFPAE
jgi:hypothetical protein